MIGIESADLVVLGPIRNLAAIVDEQPRGVGESAGIAVQRGLDEEDERGRPERVLAAMCQGIGAVRLPAACEETPGLVEDVGMLGRIERGGEDAETGRLSCGGCSGT